MRSFHTFALVLACLLTLSACGDGTGGEPIPTPGDPYPPFNGSNSVLHKSGGLEIALPRDCQDQLRLDFDPPDTEEGRRTLLSVYEKASYEAAMEEYGSKGGFLFGLVSMDQAAFEQCISSDSSGIDLFATDGERYYAYTYPTDVSFFRSGGAVRPESADWKTWEKLCEIGPLVREDFLTRNNLQSFTVQDYLNRLADDEYYVCLKYYPYFLQDGDTRPYDTLLLRQPAVRGEGGIWAVDHWLDEFGNPYLYFPDSGMPAAEYYDQLQRQCDAGGLPELLTPQGAAAAFVRDFFGQETAEGSFEDTPGINQAYMEKNQRLEQLVLAVMSGTGPDGLELLEGLADAAGDNWGLLGRHLYGSDWLSPLMSAVGSAALGTEQQRRDEAILAFLLATAQARSDFQTPLNDVLKRQREADPESFAAALAAFPEGTFSVAPGSGWISAQTGGDGQSA